MAKIILKKSNVTNKVPVVGDLDFGELALNYTDGKLWYKNNSNVITQLNALVGTVPVSQGGTGLTAIGALSVVVANSANTYTTVAATAGQSIRVNTGGTAWEAFTPSGSGTVTSVGLSAPALFTVTNSPVTGSGTLTLSYSGSALPVANGGTGLTSYTLNSIPYASATGTLATNGNLTFNGTTLTVAPAFSNILVNDVYIGRGSGGLTFNTAVGQSALNANTTGSSNTAFGYQTLILTENGFYNTAVGAQVLSTNVTGTGNTGIGRLVLRDSGKVAAAGTFVNGIVYTIKTVGTTDFVTLYGAASNTAGVTFTANTNPGTGTGTAAPNTAYNTAIGYQAMLSTTTGDNNTAVGTSALQTNTDGTLNAAFGMQASFGNTTGNGNTAIGFQSLRQNLTGIYNTAVGHQALYNTSGNYNTAVGSDSGEGITIGANNTIIGRYTGAAAPISATGSNYIVLSDGSGNVRLYSDASGNINIPSLTASKAVFTDASDNLTSTGTVGVAQGGTGLTTIAARSIAVANALNTYTTVTPAAGQSIRINAGNTNWEAYTPSAGGGGGITTGQVVALAMGMAMA
jgi:hypothetical protein